MTASFLFFDTHQLDSSRPGLPPGGRNINGYSHSWELFDMQSRKVLVGDLRRETRWKFASQVFPSTTARVGLCCPRVVATICRKKKDGRSLLCERFGWWCGLKDLKHPLDIMHKSMHQRKYPRELWIWFYVNLLGLAGFLMIHSFCVSNIFCITCLPKEQENS